MAEENSQLEPLEVTPIGHLISQKKNKFDAPHQPDTADETIDYIKLVKGKNYEHGLADLAGFSHIWLISWFNKNKTWKSKVMPPRGKQKKRGVFATRSPHRPNPIGLTAVKLVKIEDGRIYIGSHDLIDGTPIFDIKPYLKYNDIITNSSAGWVDELESELSKAIKYKIVVEPLAQKQLDWLKEREVSFIDKASQLLQQDPSPHKTRRIKKIEGCYQIACGGWRMNYQINKKEVSISSIYSGYPPESLLPERAERILNFQTHIEFYEIFG